MCRKICALISISSLILFMACGDELEGNVSPENGDPSPDAPANNDDPCQGMCEEGQQCVPNGDGFACEASGCSEESPCEEGQLCVDGGCVSLDCDPATEDCVCADENDPTTCRERPPEVTVSIVGGNFNPVRVTQFVGGTVTWTNMDDTLRSASCDDPAFDSGDMAGGDSFSFTFDTVGTFTVYDRFGAQTGSEMSVIIEEKGTD